MKATIHLLLVIAALLMTHHLNASEATSIEVGKAAPSLTGTTVDGAFDLAAFRKQHAGEHIVIAFSRASW